MDSKKAMWLSRLRKYALPISAALVVVLGAGLTRNKLAADRQGEWVRATKGDLVTGIDVIGTLAAVDSGVFGPPQLNDVWDFKISMLAPEGAEVKKGQPILAFDTTELQKRLLEKSAEADQARKEIEKRRANVALKRQDEKLRLAEAEGRVRKAQLKLESPSDIQNINERKQIEFDLTLGNREVTATRARLSSMERAASAEIALLDSKERRAAAIVADTQASIAQMTIKAPRNGTIVYVTNWRGEKKKMGDTCWRMERVIELPDLTRMMAKGDVDEVDAGKVAVGQRVTLRLDAHPDEEFKGTIHTMGRTVQKQAGTNDPLKVLRVEVQLDRTDAVKMRPGMRFQGTVELNRARQATLVPRSAVFVTDHGPVAYRRTMFAVHEVPLKLGRQNDKSVEVLAGLKPNDLVVQPKVEKEQPKS
jgi:HlyD family secretion protein